MVLASASDADLGRHAAERLIQEWGSDVDIEESLSIQFGNAAINHLAQHCKSQPQLFIASREGAQRGAETLSARPFQGILEVLQNADDAQATEVRLSFREHAGRTELLIVHDGNPLSLSDVTAMTVPWVTTKSNDASLSGRFGIGQMTLLAIGRPIDAHCHPYHFRIAETVPVAVEPAQPVPGIYDPTKRETLLVIPVDPEYRVEQLQDFLHEIGSESITFLKTVRRIALIDGGSSAVAAELTLRRKRLRSASVEVRGHKLEAEVVELFDAEGQRIIRYMVEAPISKRELRQHKATGDLTVLGVAIPAASGLGGLFDRIPLPAAYAFPFSMNAQFDPDTARSTMQENSWNAKRFDDLGDLLASVAIDLSEHEPALAWNAVPLPSELPDNGTEWLRNQYKQAILDRAHARLRSDLKVGPSEDRTSLEDVVYEEDLLDGILSDEDQSGIAPGYSTVSPADRDEYGRWRQVLDVLDLSYFIDVREALQILELSDPLLGQRSPEWFVAFGAAAVHAECFDDFCKLPSVVLEDGRRIKPPEHDEPRSLIRNEDPSSLAAYLRIALLINHAYLDGSENSELVAAELEECLLLRESIESDIDALKLLARGSKGLVKLEDDALLRLRSAFERTREEDQEALGAAIGRAVALRGFSYENGKQADTWVSPADAYLPNKIEREKYSFGNAAGTTPGIVWLSRDYASLLKAHDRQGLGPQRFLRKLGAEIVPRLSDPGDAFQKYQRDPRLVRHVISWIAPEVQKTEIQALPGHIEYLMDDKIGTDLEAVIEDIIADRTAEVRRRRAKALLIVLVRGWDRYYSKHTTAKAVTGSGGYWSTVGTVISTWLARTTIEPWLPSATGKLCPPSELHLATEANRLSEGDRRSSYLMAVDEQIAKSPALAALRIRQGPSVAKVVSRLEDLSAVSVGELTANDKVEINTTYRLLALACPRGDSPSSLRTVDDLTVSQLRSRFDGENTEGGLIFSNDLWWQPNQVRRGPAIFGKRWPFVPESSHLDRLWVTLRIPLPSATDALSILKELSTAPLADHERVIVIESMRLVAKELANLNPRTRGQMRKLPLWTGTEWAIDRPIYAVDDESVAEALRSDHSVWMPGFRIDRLQSLLEALQITYITPEEFKPIVSAGYRAADGNHLRTRFALAVQHLRSELARDDQELSETLSRSWEELASTEIVIDSGLEITASLPGHRSLTAPTSAHLICDPLTLFARTDADVGSAQNGGHAIATLFDGDRQKLAWAWEVMWQRAESGLAAERIILSTECRQHEPDEDRLAQLQMQSGERRARTASTKAAVKQGASSIQPTVRTRVLKNLHDLVPTGGRVINKGADQGGIALPIRRPIKAEGSIPSGPKDAPVAAQKAVLPPMDDREQLAYDAVQMALALDDEEIIDLRSMRGVGADAVDELRQFFEIKMASGADFPNEVTLTASEYERARSNPDFFLAVVAGLEDKAGKLRVRFIFDPLGQLKLKIRNDVTLAGVRDAEALEHEFDTRMQEVKA